MSRQADTKLIQGYRYQQGDTGSAGYCDSCGKLIRGRRVWYRVTFTDCGDEWDCSCRKCAIEEVRRFDADIAAHVEKWEQERDDAPCQCGSGKKFKRCCLNALEQKGE